MKNRPGEFYFKITENGVLEGEFTNRSVNSFGTEVCVPVPSDCSADDSLAGTYRSTWTDADTGEPDGSQLVIQHEFDSNEQIKSPRRYYLEWIDPVSLTTRFHGFGFVFDRLLIGHYRGGRL